MRLSIFAKRNRGKPVGGAWQQRDRPKPYAQVIQAAIRTSEQLGPGWWQMAVRLGLSDTSSVTVLADGAKWIWNPLAEHLPGVAGILDIHHASEHLCAAARTSPRNTPKCARSCGGGGSRCCVLVSRGNTTAPLDARLDNDNLRTRRAHRLQ
ncbi:hypothetical protein [Gemmata massiliana]|nr:hypothetical protein [Gemmata massiliana]